MATKPAQSAQEKQVATAAIKSKKFVELAQKRVSRALATLDQVAMLANRRSYLYTPDQVKKIGDALVAKVQAVGSAFSADNSPSTTFKL